MRTSSLVLVLLTTVAIGQSVACSSATQRSDASPAPPTLGGGADDSGAADWSLADNDPTSCALAEQAKSYLGCDFWPTVTFNRVDPSFDFTAVVSNPQSVEATVTVSRANGYQTSVKVAARSSGKIYLPWVQNLKQGMLNTRPSAAAPQVLEAAPSSVLERGGAYHLVSSVPVVVYQFNPLEYTSLGGSGPVGKDWPRCELNPEGQCYSYSNDASLLLPSTALTGNYRIYGPSSNPGVFDTNPQTGEIVRFPDDGLAFAAITATKDGTTVQLKLSSKGAILSGPGIAAAAAGTPVTLELNAGDVAILQSASNGGDLSGSLLTANAGHAVQVITGLPCTFFPYDTQACDHVEESLFPLETLGRRYHVIPPTGPDGEAHGMLVRIHGNVDNTQLSYFPAAPAGCPTVIHAGENIECRSFETSYGIIRNPFEIIGNHEFMVSTYQLGGPLADPGANTYEASGDPSQSQAVAVEQYRTAYSFLTPNDYDKSYVDIVAPQGTRLQLDGKDIKGAVTPLSSGYELRRILLNNAVGVEAHRIRGTSPFGIQVSGYGSFTSYQYPGGLNLGLIAEVPVN